MSSLLTGVRRGRPLAVVFALALAMAAAVFGGLAPASGAVASPSTAVRQTSTDASAVAATSGPCDIYASGGTPCVAAHSTTRALYAAYNGALYQVQARVGQRHPRHRRAERGRLRQRRRAGLVLRRHELRHHHHLRPVRPGQQPHPGAPGGFTGPAAGGYDNLANATAAPVTVGGHKAYGVFVAPGTGYRNNNTNGIATGDQPEGMYAIFDGTALQRRLLLRLRQRRDEQPRQRQRHHGGHLLRQHQGLGLRLAATARGSWPTWRTACSPASTPATTPTTRPSTTGS